MGKETGDVWAAALTDCVHARCLPGPRRPCCRRRYIRNREAVLVAVLALALWALQAQGNFMDLNYFQTVEKRAING